MTSFTPESVTSTRSRRTLDLITQTQKEEDDYDKKSNECVQPLTQYRSEEGFVDRKKGSKAFLCERLFCLCSSHRQFEDGRGRVKAKAGSFILKEFRMGSFYKVTTRCCSYLSIS